MPNEEWEQANTEQKLELLRKDVRDIAAAQNGVARDFRLLLHRFDELIRALAAPEQTHQQSEAGEPTSREENRPEPPNTSRSGA